MVHAADHQPADRAGQRGAGRLCQQVQRQVQRPRPIVLACVEPASAPASAAASAAAPQSCRGDGGWRVPASPRRPGRPTRRESGRAGPTAAGPAHPPRQATADQQPRGVADRVRQQRPNPSRGDDRETAATGPGPARDWRARAQASIAPTPVAIAGYPGKRQVCDEQGACSASKMFFRRIRACCWSASTPGCARAPWGTTSPATATRSGSCCARASRRSCCPTAGSAARRARHHAHQSLPAGDARGRRPGTEHEDTRAAGARWRETRTPTPRGHVRRAQPLPDVLPASPRRRRAEPERIAGAAVFVVPNPSSLNAQLPGFQRQLTVWLQALHLVSWQYVAMFFFFWGWFWFSYVCARSHDRPESRPAARSRPTRLVDPSTGHDPRFRRARRREPFERPLPARARKSSWGSSRLSFNR